MAHEIGTKDAVAYGRKAAWHGLGHVEGELMSVDRAAEMAKLAENDVVMRQIAQIDPSAFDMMVKINKWGYTPTLDEAVATLKALDIIDSHKAIVREEDKTVFGIHKAGYHMISNTDVADWFRDIVGDEKCIEAAGTLHDGAKVWMLADISGGDDFHLTANHNDTIKKYALLTSSHDGSSALQAYLTPVRVVCQNTLTAATSMAGIRDGISIKHTENSGARMEQGKQIMASLMGMYGNLDTVWNFLAEQQITTRDQAEAFIKQMLPDNPNSKKHTRTENARAEALDLFENGHANNLPGIGNTWYAAYNAVTEYIDHHRGTRATAGPDATEAQKTQSRNENRFIATTTGVGAMMKQTALVHAMAGASGKAYLSSTVAVASSGLPAVTVDGSELFQSLISKSVADVDTPDASNGSDDLVNLLDRPVKNVG